VDAFIKYCSCLATSDLAKRVPSHIPSLAFTEPALLASYRGTSMVPYVKVPDVRYSYPRTSNHASVDGFGLKVLLEDSASKKITDTYFVIYG
jgi:hypothetical protein